MDLHLLYELVGYAASALVAVSLMMKSIRRLRVYNLVGALAFTAYGLLIGAYPVAAVNLFIVFINLYYLRQMAATREYFDLLRIQPDSEYLRSFLEFHREDIQRFAPGFAYAPGERSLQFFVLRDMVPAGLFIGEADPEGCLRVKLDYVIPQYRDLQTGRYVFGAQADFFRALGIDEIYSDPGNPTHTAYLRRMGFTPVDPGNPASAYRLAIAA
jgi:hypothetical protein